MPRRLGDDAPDFTAESSTQLTARHEVATPVNRKQGEDVGIAPSVTNVEAQAKFPGGWKAPKPCLRIVPQPE